MLTPFVKSGLRAMGLFGGLIAASLLIRGLSWFWTPAVTRSETEAIFIFLACTVLLLGLVVLRHIDHRAVRVGSVFVGTLLLSSSIGALIRSLNGEIAGARAPVVFHFHQPVRISSARGHGRKDEVRVVMSLHGDTSLQERLRAVAAGELQLYLRVPASCEAGSCEMSVVDPKTGKLARATRRVSDFEIRFRDGHPFRLDASIPVTLVFEFSDQITLYARDIGLPASARSDRLVHSGQELPLPFDRLIFARFMFLDVAGKPHSAIY